MPLFLKATDLKLKIVRADAPASRSLSSSALKGFLKKSRSLNTILACESAALAVLQVPQPTHQYKLTSCAIGFTLLRSFHALWRAPIVEERAAPSKQKWAAKP